MENKIRECLEIIEYNPDKHSTLKSCIHDILSRDEYDKIMRGIIIDKKNMEKVQKIIEAYNFLEEHEDEMLKVVGELNKPSSNSTEVLEQVFIYYDDDDKVYRVMKKEQETGNYVQLHASNYIHVEDNFYIIKLGVQKLLCNLKGETLKILNCDNNVISENIFKLTDKIIVVNQTLQNKNSYRQESRTCYIKLEKDKEEKFKELINPSEFVEMILSSDQVDANNKNYIFDVVFYGKKINYGNKKYKSIEVINNYIYAIGYNDDISYFTLDGEQIVSTDKDNYFYIGRLVANRENKKNIVVVGKYDDTLSKKYNYYDLDSKQEVSKQDFYEALDWMNYGAIVYTPELAIIRENKRIIPYNCEGVFPIINSPIHKNKKMIARSVKEWKKNIYIVEFADFNKTEFSNDSYYVNDENMCEEVSYWNYESNKVYALIKDIYKNPQQIGNYFREYRMFDKKSDLLYIIPVLHNERWLFYFKTLDINGNENYIIRDSSKNNDQITKITGKKNNVIGSLPVSNSAFLLPGDIKAKKQELVTLKNDLINLENYNGEKVGKNDESFSYSWFQGIYPTILIRQIKYIDKNNTVIVGVMNKDAPELQQYYDVAVNKSGKPIFYDKAKPISVDSFGNIIMSVSFGNGQRYILVNSNEEIVIGFSEEIIPNNGLYIVFGNGKYQLYNSNGVAVTVSTDKQEWVKKYYINSCGVIHDIQEKLLITNSGYKYLVDDEGDITIKENKEYSKVLQRIMQLSKTTSEVEEQ